MVSGKILMLDTNILIDLYKQSNRTMSTLQEYKNYTLAISHLVLIEFMAGIQIKHKNHANKFIKSFKLLYYDNKSQQKTQQLVSKIFLGRENKPIDVMIAGHVLSFNAHFITSNYKDYLYKGLKIIPYKK